MIPIRARIAALAATALLAVHAHAWMALVPGLMTIRAESVTMSSRIGGDREACRTSERNASSQDRP